MNLKFEQLRTPALRWLHAYRWPVAAALLLAEWPALSSARQTLRDIHRYAQLVERSEKPISDLYDVSVAVMVAGLICVVFTAFVLPEMVRFGILKSESIFQARLCSGLFAPLVVLVPAAPAPYILMHYYDEVDHFQFLLDDRSAFGDPFYLAVSLIAAVPLAMMAGACLLLGATVWRVKVLKTRENPVFPPSGTGYPGFYPR